MAANPEGDRGRNRTITDADVRSIANATASAVVNSADLIELVTNIIDGELDVKLKPIHDRLDVMRKGLRIAGGGAFDPANE